MRLSALAFAALLPLPALAQSGFAYVQAPEQSSGIAFAETPAEAFAAATQGCLEGGAEAENCIPMTWCQPSGWAIDVFLQHSEGPHWHEVHCGLPARATAEALADLLCDRTARPYLIECAMVQMWDPDGTQVRTVDDAPLTKG